MSLHTHPFLLTVIIDGLGLCKNRVGNAYYLAKTPCLDFLQKNSLYQTLGAHGPYVGLSSQTDPGNSEVGHNAMGAGRIIKQGQCLVEEAFVTKRIYKSPLWQRGVQQLHSHNTTLHLIGLLSDGGVHSQKDDFLQIIEESSVTKIQKIRIHALLDGRDVDPQSAEKYIRELEEILTQKRSSGFDYQIASVGGREVICMDRYEANWQMIQSGWDLIVEGKGELFATAMEGLSYRRRQQGNVTDQEILPFCVGKEGFSVGKVEEGDVVVWMNFRGDRSIQMCRVLEGEEGLIKKEKNPNIFFMGLTRYDHEKGIPKHFLVSPPQIKNCMGEVLVGSKIRSFALSETQKYGHVTYFWNGNRSGYIDEDLERYIEIESDVGACNRKPQMKAREITDATIELILSGLYQTGRINFPNPDMIGHTGDLDATVKAVEIVDQQLQRLYQTLQKIGGTLLVTADHGNCEEMLDFSQGMADKPRIKTSHTTNRVPFFLQTFNPREKWILRNKNDTNAGLSNITSTVLDLLRIVPPQEYEPSLIQLQS